MRLCAQKVAGGLQYSVPCLGARQPVALLVPHVTCWDTSCCTEGKGGSLWPGAPVPTGLSAAPLPEPPSRTEGPTAPCRPTRPQGRAGWKA